MSDRTLTFIKPEAVDDGYAGKIISVIESSGFKIIGSKMIRMNLKTAREFYKVHQDKEFYRRPMGRRIRGHLCALVQSIYGRTNRRGTLVHAGDFGPGGGIFGQSLRTVAPGADFPAHELHIRHAPGHGG